MANLQARLLQALGPVEGPLLRTVLGLPPRLQRVFAGRRVVLDGQILDVEAQLLLRLLRLSGRAEIGFSPDDRAQLDNDAAMIGGSQPIGEVRSVKVTGGAGHLDARLYVPQVLLDSDGDDPLLVYFHGGGWVVGNLDSHDAPCRVLAERAGVRVLSVDYRLAPEHPFPAAAEDAVASSRWAVEHAAELGADPGRIAVGGDSAGGNLAAVAALEAARSGLSLRFQLLVYPATDFASDSASRRLFSSGFFLTRSGLDEARIHYLGNGNRTDPLASPLHAEVPAGLAPAYVATAGFDPLRDEGEAYAQRLTEAGVNVTVRRFTGLIHSFFNAVGVGTAPREAVNEIADALGRALAD